MDKVSDASLPEVRIAQGSHVTLHFSLALTNGEIIDSNFGGKAASFIVGDGSLLPGFEQRLLGLRAGETSETLIPVAEAFGPVNSENVQYMNRDKFSGFMEEQYQALEAGVIVAFKDAGGFDLPGVIKAIDKDGATVDFNHPLAGREICFKAEIISVLPDGTSTLEIKS